MWGLLRRPRPHPHPHPPWRQRRCVPGQQYSCRPRCGRRWRRDHPQLRHARCRPPIPARTRIRTRNRNRKSDIGPSSCVRVRQNSRCGLSSAYPSLGHSEPCLGSTHSDIDSPICWALMTGTSSPRAFLRYLAFSEQLRHIYRVSSCQRHYLLRGVLTVASIRSSALFRRTRTLSGDGGRRT